MTSYRLFLLAGCAGLSLCAGCARSLDGKLEIPDVCAANIDKPQAMQIAEDVLAGMHFAIEKADLDSGLIRTRPLSGAQFFEFWRSDNAGLFNAALANLHSIRRNAEVRIQQRGDRVFVLCDVRIQKLSLPESPSADRPSPGAPVRRLTSTPEQERGITWIDLGKDTMLSTEILNRIQKHILARRSFLVSRTSDESQATGDEK